MSPRPDRGDRGRAAERFDLADPRLIFAPDVVDDPAPLFAHLRETSPVWEVPGTSTFLVTATGLVNEAAARTGDFSSNLTSVLCREPDGRPGVYRLAGLGEATHVLATADPPAHTAHRALLRPHLAPERVARLEGEVRELAAELLAALVVTGAGDAVDAVADPLPMLVVCRILGVPTSDAVELVELVRERNVIMSGVADRARIDRAIGSVTESGGYLAGHLRAALAGGGAPDGLVGVIASAVESGALDAGTGVGILQQLLGAGTETTASLIASAVLTLASEPALQRSLRADASLIGPFLEEVLRVDGPFRFHYRAVTRTCELGGVTIPVGSRLALVWAAANHDAEDFPDPTTLRAPRPAGRPHHAFGRGIHYCIGAPLARLEAGVVVEELLAATDHVALDDDHPPRHHHSIFLRRLESLPVRVTRRPGRR